MLDRRLQAHAQGQQILDLGARPAPLFPIAHAHAPSDPLVQFRDWTVILADAKVRRPASKVLPQFFQPVFHGNAPASSGQLLDPVLEVRQCPIGPAYLLALDREPEEGAFTHRCNFAFGHVDFEFELGFQVSRDGAHHPLCGALAFDQNDDLCWPSPVSTLAPGCRWSARLQAVLLSLSILLSQRQSFKARCVSAAARIWPARA